MASILVSQVTLSGGSQAPIPCKQQPLGEVHAEENRALPFSSQYQPEAKHVSHLGIVFFSKQINLQVRAVQSMSECNLMRGDTWSHPAKPPPDAMRGINKLLELTKSRVVR